MSDQCQDGRRGTEGTQLQLQLHDGAFLAVGAAAAADTLLIPVPVPVPLPLVVVVTVVGWYGPAARQDRNWWFVRHRGVEARRRGLQVGVEVVLDVRRRLAGLLLVVVMGLLLVVVAVLRLLLLRRLVLVLVLLLHTMMKARKGE